MRSMSPWGEKPTPLVPKVLLGPIKNTQLSSVVSERFKGPQDWGELVHSVWNITEAVDDDVLAEVVDVVKVHLEQLYGERVYPDTIEVCLQDLPFSKSTREF